MKRARIYPRDFAKFTFRVITLAFANLHNSYVLIFDVDMEFSRVFPYRAWRFTCPIYSRWWEMIIARDRVLTLEPPTKKC